MTGYAQLLPEILLLAGALLALFGEWLPGRDRGAAFIGAALALAAALAAAYSVLGDTLFGGLLYFDAPSRFIRVGVALLTALWLLWFADRPIAGERSREAVALVMFSATGAVLVAVCADLITLFMALELSTMPAYVLMGYRRRDARGLEGALKYFLLSMLTSLIMLYGLSFLYGISGSTMFNEIALALPGAGTLALVAAVLTFVGVFAKLSAAPFHFWAPDAYAGAPAASVAFVSTVPKLAGAAVMVRLAQAVAPGVPQLGSVVMIVAAASIVLGNLAALSQRDLKRMMAYSGVAHAGYQLIALAAAITMVGLPSVGNGFVAVLFYALAYAIPSMAIMFVVAEEGDAIEDLAGLSERRPAAAWGIFVLLLSLVGIPPLAGFFGKLYLLGAGLDASMAWLVIVAVLGSVVSVGYYFRIVRAMFFDAPQTHETTTSEDLAEKPSAPICSWPSSLAFAIAVLVSIALGIGAAPVLGFLGL
ncbi:MAG: NADH-quinone oxidoreductase subunit N [Coriobacteriia bacterium]|nr:NADH-quinone oxidoreductase subunit N [Coriobacteriia bacterium]